MLRTGVPVVLTLQLQQYSQYLLYLYHQNRINWVYRIYSISCILWIYCTIPIKHYINNDENVLYYHYFDYFPVF